ncbi:hypothetical protein [Piscirickettsia litoralis]|uniref:Outer membrane lipoprotein carrier protein LolA n=1 Tax=Piscirickettsia litoralis TaxID=1891921 RepID=A0ABX3A2M0_9GAMM|nr:hypothetical protein [Piscirickettsia litoralis]ODN42750.1 hypothetical protein BGC07_07215 [Piscirickettsia litoralis]
MTIHSSGIIEQQFIDQKQQSRKIIIKNDQLYFYSNSQLSQTLTIKDYPLLEQLVTSLRSLTSNSSQSLSNHYLINLIGTNQHWSLILIPKKIEQTTITQIKITGNSSQLKTFALSQNSGAKWSMRFTHAPIPTQGQN